MGEVLWTLACCGVSALLAWHLGTRWERGRWMRLQEITSEARQARRGVKLRTLKIRR